MRKPVCYTSDATLKLFLSIFREVQSSIFPVQFNINLKRIFLGYKAVALGSP